MGPFLFYSQVALSLMVPSGKAESPEPVSEKAIMWSPGKASPVDQDYTFHKVLGTEERKAPLYL